MPLTPEDLEAMSFLVGRAVASVMQQVQAPGMNPHAAKPRIDERHYRKLQPFNGTNWKDWSFQFRSATRGSCEAGHQMLTWAEHEQQGIEDFDMFEMDEELARKLSGELFNTLTTLLSGEPSQRLHNCNFNGAEAWRKLTKRYSPSTPLRAMQLMLQVVTPEKAKHVKDVPNLVERWETRVLALQRDFREKVSSRMKAAILLSMLPNDIRDALIQQADKYEDYVPTKEKVLSIVEAKMAMRSPDEMDVDAVTQQNWDTHEYTEQGEEIQALGKGGIHCYRCGGQGHISTKCATPPPDIAKGKGKSKGGKDGKGQKSKGKGKGDWTGYCSYCGKRGHSPRDCWTKQKDDESAGNGRLASVEDDGEYGGDVGGFDIARIDLPLNAVENQSDDSRVISRGKITIDSGAAESVMPTDMLEGVKLQESEGSRNGISYVAANGGKMPNLGEKKVHFKTRDGMDSSIVFQVTHARKPLASVSKIVRKGNRVVFSQAGSYIENLRTGQKIELEESGGAYHLDVNYVSTAGTTVFARQA